MRSSFRRSPGSRVTRRAIVAGFALPACTALVLLAGQAGHAFGTAPLSTHGPRDSSASALAATEWRAAGGADGSHFSPLAEIDRDNVASLQVAWTYRTGDVSDGTDSITGTSFQATPLMVDGTLFFPTPFSRVIALDAETGAERWTFDPHVDRSSRVRTYATSRGVALWDAPAGEHAIACTRRIFVATIDARLIALDAHTGTSCVDFAGDGEINLKDGVRGIRPDLIDYRQTAPPTVVGDLVLVGSSIIDNWRAASPAGLVRAFDARTGALRWAWEPLIEVESADGDTVAVVGAANAWGTFSVDTARGLVFVPTGSASPDHYGGLRPGDNRHANSVTALDVRTGTVAWSFQLVHHDLWDYDVASQPALADITRDGESIPVVIASSKAGNLFFLRRDTGIPFFPVEERPVPASDVPGEVASPTQPFPVVPRPLAPQGLTAADAWGLTPLDEAWCRRRIEGLRSGGMYMPPSVQGTIAFPGFVGGVAWSGFGVDNANGIVVTTTNRLPGIITLVPADQLEGVVSTGDHRGIGPQVGAPYGSQRDLLLSPLHLPCTKPPWGTLIGIDMASGAVRWEVPLGSMRDLVHVPLPASWGSVSLGGPLVTGSGLVFIGASIDRRFRAFDVETGREIWEVEIPASAQATPLTYRARAGGRQFVVIAAGGHSVMHSAMGDYLIAYALP